METTTLGKPLVIGTDGKLGTHKAEEAAGPSGHRTTVSESTGFLADDPADVRGIALADWLNMRSTGTDLLTRRWRYGDLIARVLDTSGGSPVSDVGLRTGGTGGPRSFHLPCRRRPANRPRSGGGAETMKA